MYDFNIPPVTEGIGLSQNIIYAFLLISSISSSAVVITIVKFTPLMFRQVGFAFCLWLGFFCLWFGFFWLLGWWWLCGCLWRCGVRPFQLLLGTAFRVVIAVVLAVIVRVVCAVVIVIIGCLGAIVTEAAVHLMVVA